MRIKSELMLRRAPGPWKMYSQCSPSQDFCCLQEKGKTEWTVQPGLLGSLDATPPSLPGSAISQEKMNSFSCQGPVILLSVWQLPAANPCGEAQDSTSVGREP